VPGGATEQQPLVARKVNLSGTLHLLDACGEQVDAGGQKPRFVFASTIAVLGAQLPERVNDATPTRPTMSYGAHKLMGEIAVADFTRRGGCEGVSLRLPGVLARPPARTGQLTAFLSDLMRDPAARHDVVCPMSANATTWAASTPSAVDSLLHAACFDTTGLPVQRALTLPALCFSMAQLLDALASVHGEYVREHVRFEPDSRIEALFGRYPPLETEAADAAGFKHDGSLTRLVQRALEPC
jgi:nucleoside-diphosphate-sugar epimerase